MANKNTNCDLWAPLIPKIGIAEFRAIPSIEDNCYRLSGVVMVGVGPKPVWQSVSRQLRCPSRSTTLRIIWVAGFIDVVLLGSFAIGPPEHREVASPSKLQHRLANAAPNTLRSLQISGFSEAPSSSKPATAQRDVVPQRDAALEPLFRTDSASPEPVTPPPSESLSRSDSQGVTLPNSNSTRQSSTSVQSDTVPLPTRKPEIPTAKRPSKKKASMKRTLKQAAEREARPPLRFGNFGYNPVGQ
jgi:hypothetical protein